MTRARALKQLIRSRAAKTGERYTTARRHVLAGLSARAAAAKPAQPTKPQTAQPKAVKGGVSDAKIRERTGHGLDHWFDVLDRFGAVQKGHTAAARHLYDEHAIPGWHAQGITVAYERARGVRAVNQRCDGEFEVSVSKVVAAGTREVVDALTGKAVRRRWTTTVDPQLAKALGDALEGPASKGVVVRSDGQARFRYKWDDSIVQLYLYPKAGGKVSVVVTNSKLADAAAVETRRAQWRAALNALSAVVS
jgi:hypothetical protein